jgi:hypothetical protein
MTDSRVNGSESMLRVPCEVYSRIVGYLRPVQDWNRGKQQEFSERRPFRYEPLAGDEEGEADRSDAE